MSELKGDWFICLQFASSSKQQGLPLRHTWQRHQAGDWIQGKGKPRVVERSGTFCTYLTALAHCFRPRWFANSKMNEKGPTRLFHWAVWQWNGLMPFIYSLVCGNSPRGLAMCFQTKRPRTKYRQVHSPSAGSSRIESLDPTGRQNWACQSSGFICATSPSRQKLLDEGLPGTPLITKFDLFSVGTSTSSMASHSHPTRVVWVLQPQSPNYAGWRTHIARAGRSGEMFGGEVDKVSAPCHVGPEPFGAEPVIHGKLQTTTF